MATIDQAFRDLINTKGIAQKLQISTLELIVLRIEVEEDIPISLDTKIELLFRSGWRQEVQEYTPGDLVCMLRYCKQVHHSDHLE